MFPNVAVQKNLRGRDTDEADESILESVHLILNHGGRAVVHVDVRPGVRSDLVTFGVHAADGGLLGRVGAEGITPVLTVHEEGGLDIVLLEDIEEVIGEDVRALFTISTSLDGGGAWEALTSSKVKATKPGREQLSIPTP